MLQLLSYSSEPFLDCYSLEARFHKHVLLKQNNGSLVSNNTILKNKLIKYADIFSRRKKVGERSNDQSSFKNQLNLCNIKIQKRRLYYNDIDCLIDSLNELKHDNMQDSDYRDALHNNSKISAKKYTEIKISRFPDTLSSNESIMFQDAFDMDETSIEKNKPSAKMTVTNILKKEINYGNDWCEEREVQVTRDSNKSFGISIVGGTVNVADNKMVSGIFIKNILANSSAEQCSLLNIGDRILEVDGINIRNSTHEQAMITMKNAGPKMTLLVQSIVKHSDEFSQVLTPKKIIPAPITPCKTPDRELIQEGNSFLKSNAKNEIEHSETNHELPSKDMDSITPQPTTDSEHSSDEDDDENMEGKTVTKAGVEIDRASAGNIKRSKEELSIDREQEDCFGYTMCKLKKKYGSVGHVFMHTIERTNNGYLGISLAGHRDRTKMACFIAGINPKGMASSAPIEVGDELAEVNGIVLQGRSHLNVPAILKSIIGTSLKFVIIRRKPSSEDLAVKPVTQFPICLDDEDVFSQYNNVRIVQIKKGPSGLGIMIIEGKHAEVGQGIFISDIQEGSMADKAGLHIGEMILAVNKDSLIGCSYEAAASLLKKSDGVVILKICNPSKTKELSTNSTTNSSNMAAKVSTEINTTPVSSENAKQSSRPVTPMPKKSPAKEIVDPSKALIITNESTTIEIDTNNKPLGVIAVGKELNINNEAVIIDILPDGIAFKDKRLQIFDHITEINGIKISPDCSEKQLQKYLKDLLPKMRLTIFRPDGEKLEKLEVDIVKKTGKQFGIGIRVQHPKGVILTDMLSGGIVELDGRMRKGDIITHINSESLSNISYEDCSLLLKTLQGKATFSILRPLPNKR